MTKEERDKLVFDITEQVLLRMPEVIGNLMRNHAEINKLNKGFYEKHPEFKADPASVRSVIFELERDNPAIEHQEILDKAAPLIKRRMGTLNDLDTSVTPSRDELNLSSNGAL